MINQFENAVIQRSGNQEQKQAAQAAPFHQRRMSNVVQLPQLLEYQQLNNPAMFH
jgi:hypothetical protein